MFERFTDDARRTVVLAQEAARELHHPAIGTEHLLLGVLRCGQGPALAALAALDVPPGTVGDRVIAMVERGPVEPGSTIPFTRDAKKVLELALRESLRSGSSEITSGHILLALMDEGSGSAAEALRQCGVDVGMVRAAVLSDDAAGAGPEQPRPRPLGPRGRRPQAPPLHGSGAPGTRGPGPAPRGPALFEALDDAAWDAVDRARRMARERAGPVIGCTDLLAGLATVTGPGADVLHGAGIDAAAVAAAVAATDGGAEQPPAALPLDPTARAALAAAAHGAAVREHAAITTAHLLHGLLTVADAELEALADQHGVDLPALRGQVIRRLDEPEV